MNSFVIELKNKTLIKIGVKAIHDFYKTLAIDQLHFSGLDVFATRVNSSSLNVVLDARENETLDAYTINAITHFFKKHQIPWRWFITAVSHTNDIEQHGFNLSYITPGMYFDLSNKLPNSGLQVDIM